MVNYKWRAMVIYGVKFIRDIDKVSKRERTIAGVVSTIIGIGVIFLMDWSMGESVDSSIVNVAVTMGLGVAFLGGYKLILKRRKKTSLN